MKLLLTILLLSTSAFAWGDFSCDETLSDCGKFGGNGIAAVVLIVVFSALLCCNLYCFCVANSKGRRVEMHQTHQHSLEQGGYIRLRDVLPHELANETENVLDDKEKNELLWVGTYVYTTTWRVCSVFFAVFLPGLGIFFSLIAWQVVGELIYFISAFTISFIFSLFYLLFISRYKRVPVYCLTPSEAIIIGKVNACSGVSVQRFPYCDMPSIETQFQSNGLGSIYFGSKLVQTRHGHSHMRVGFINIRDVKRIESKMRELKQNCQPIMVMGTAQGYMQPVMVPGMPAQPYYTYQAPPTVPMYTTQLE